MFIVVKAIFGLLFVLGLFYASVKLLQKYTNTLKGTSTGNIALEGAMYIDDSTKVVSVTQGPVGYLLLISKNGNLLLDKYEKQ
ncbi:MAG: hypothetical protein V4485_02785 [Pseudomonadota bacterium]